MKAFILAAAIAALSTSAIAGAAREARPPAEAPASVIADAGRLSTGLTSLNDGSPWASTSGTAATDAGFESLAAQVDTGSLLVILCVAGFAMSRPIARRLRRQEQQRRATALASTLPHEPRH